MDRITDKHLQELARLINISLGRPTTYWDAESKKCNIGHFYIDGAYGGVELSEVCTDGGGVRSVFNCGHVTKRNLRDRLHAFLAGIKYQKDTLGSNT